MCHLNTLCRSMKSSQIFQRIQFGNGGRRGKNFIAKNNLVRYHDLLKYFFVTNNTCVKWKSWPAVPNSTEFISQPFASVQNKRWLIRDSFVHFDWNRSFVIYWMDSNEKYSRFSFVYVNEHMEHISSRQNLFDTMNDWNIDPRNSFAHKLIIKTYQLFFGKFTFKKKEMRLHSKSF